MSRIGTSLIRTTTLMSSESLLNQLRRTQVGLFEAERAISSGKSVNSPSDAPHLTSGILLLREQLAAREQHTRNLTHASGMLNISDQALADVTDITLEARSIAATQIGVTSNADTRANQATVVEAQLQALIDIANRQIQGISLFGGNRSGAPGENVFVDFLGGVRYIGSSDENLRGDFGIDAHISFNTNGQTAFGGLSSRIISQIDVDPQATAATSISEVNGAQNIPVRLGTVSLQVNASQTNVDLSTADTLDDIVTRINDAINNINPAAGALAITGGGFELSSGVGHTVTITDLVAGQTAKDLGIDISATGGATTAGVDLGVQLTRLTQLADLGVAVDFASGLTVTQGSTTKVADFSTATTVEDLMNVIDQLDLGVRMQINEDKTGLNIVNEVSGLAMSIGETAGGTTAGDLGLRTMGTQTQLSDFRFGLGVETEPGKDDFLIDLHDGSSFSVDIDNVNTVGELLTAISTAATTAGLTVGAIGAGGTDINIGLATSGNGLMFEDGTAGAGDFRVQQMNTSLAATHLGIYTNAGAGSTITGTDEATVRTDSVFTHFMNLRDSLATNNESGITLAGGNLETSIDKLTRARADLGVRTQRIEQLSERSAQLKLMEQSLLSEMQDADLTEMITRFTQLQQQLAAGLQVGATNLQLSLLNFLR